VLDSKFVVCAAVVIPVAKRGVALRRHRWCMWCSAQWGVRCLAVAFWLSPLADGDDDYGTYGARIMPCPTRLTRDRVAAQTVLTVLAGGVAESQVTVAGRGGGH
jgi:hypothetical protein